MVTGDSGEEDGEGSVNEDESAVEIVVVGDESVDSDACVDVESRCLCWPIFSLSDVGKLASSGNVGNLLSPVATPLLSILLWSNPYTLIKDGKWL